jgi:hypothetical protein
MRAFLMAAATAAGLAFASSVAVAAPIAPIGKTADAVTSATPVYYRYYYHRHYRHCWWRHGYRVCRGWY